MTALAIKPTQIKTKLIVNGRNPASMVEIRQ